MSTLLILGAGGYGRTVADLASQLGIYERIAFLDDHATGEYVLGKCQDFILFSPEDTWIYPGFGDNAVRMNWICQLEQAHYPIPTLVHPRAYVSPTAQLGRGTVVLPTAVVNTGVKVGKGCIINIGALIDHDSVLEDGIHLAPGAVVKAENRIPAGSKIGSGVVIENRQYPL